MIDSLSLVCEDLVQCKDLSQCSLDVGVIDIIMELPMSRSIYALADGYTSD